MPAGDGTGPTGMGPMTGRASGFCAGYAMPGYMNPGWGRGMGFGRGRGFGGGGRGGGRGWRNMFSAIGPSGWQGWGMPGAMSRAAGPTREQELEILRGQAEHFEASLDGIRKRLQELETEKTE